MIGGSCTCRFSGSHQAHNVGRRRWRASTFWPRLEPGLAVTRDDVVRGFAALKWPARVEVVGQNPWLVIDGAHNVASAARVWPIRCAPCFPPSRRTLVFGTTRDKDLAGQLQALLPCFDTLIATRYVENPRVGAAGGDRRPNCGHGRSPSAHRAEPAQALALRESLTEPDGLICVTGSLFLAAEARAIALDLARPPSFTRVVT